MFLDTVLPRDLLVLAGRISQGSSVLKPCSLCSLRVSIACMRVSAGRLLKWRSDGALTCRDRPSCYSRGLAATSWPGQSNTAASIFAGAAPWRLHAAGLWWAVCRERRRAAAAAGHHDAGRRRSLVPFCSLQLRCAAGRPGELSCVDGSPAAEPCLMPKKGMS